MALLALPPVIPITCPAAAREISSGAQCGYVRAPRGERALLALAWRSSPLARATLTGWVASERLAASMLAP